MMFIQKIFLLFLATVALAENATVALEENATVALEENATVALAENATTEENVSEGIDYDMEVLGNETNGTVPLEEVEVKTFCVNTNDECHKQGGVCMTSHGIKRSGSGGHCSSTKTFPFANCPTCYCCVEIKCQDSSSCRSKGGYCTTQSKCSSGHFSFGYCGTNCGCCMPNVLPPHPEVCDTTSECKNKGGYCCGHDHCKSGHFVKRHCHGGSDCGCCLSRPDHGVTCKSSSECESKGGYCCGRDHCKSGHFVKRHCKGHNCGCCLEQSCRAKQSCTRAKGQCKSSCKSDESEIHGGCRGSGCKCCAHRSHPSPYGRSVVNDDEDN